MGGSLACTGVQHTTLGSARWSCGAEHRARVVLYLSSHKSFTVYKH